MKNNALKQDELIFSYINSEISDEEKVLFENMLNNDEQFKIKFNEIKIMMDSLGNLPSYKASSNFEFVLNENIKRIKEQSKISDVDSYNSKSSIYDRIEYYFLNNRFKSTLGFSFILIFLSVFFISRIDNDIHNNVTNNNAKNTAKK